MADAIGKKPSDFYFAVGENKRKQVFFAITPRSYYDEHGKLLDKTDFVPRKVLPEGFVPFGDSLYHFYGDPSEGVDELKARGFVNNGYMAQLVRQQD